jgi:rubrerythrin
MELINENKLGVAKGTDVEEAVNMNFAGETQEAGLYIAMARQAQREGLPEIAIVLESIAMDELNHAARFAELNGKISSSTKENIEMMLKGEIGANNGKKSAAKKAKEIDCDEAHDLFDEASRDEARHARALQGMLNRFFG